MRFCLEPTTLNREAAVLTGSGVEQKSMRGHTNGDEVFFQARGVLSELSKMNHLLQRCWRENLRRPARQQRSRRTPFPLRSVMYKPPSTIHVRLMCSCSVLLHSVVGSRQKRIACTLVLFHLTYWRRYSIFHEVPDVTVGTGWPFDACVVKQGWQATGVQQEQQDNYRTTIGQPIGQL